MAKGITRTIKIPQPSIFGRIGTGIGQGLAQQLPEEIQRGRLAAGLKELSQQKNLTPFQTFAGLVSQPGITPQAIQTGGELLRQQGIRNAYANTGVNPRSVPGSSLDQVDFANLKQSQSSPIQSRSVPSDRNAPGIPQKNPLRPEAMPKLPWTPERRNEERFLIGQQFPFLNDQQINEMAGENERRELAIPEAEQAIDQRLDEIRAKANDTLLKRLKLKTQKSTDNELFEAIPGEIINNLEREMASELATNPDANIDKLADKYSHLGLENSKAAKDVETILSKNWFSQTPSTMLAKLKSAQKPYEEAGNKEGYFNKLIESGFSPQRAAQISYPLSSRLNSYVNSHKRLVGVPKNFIAGSRAIAKNVEKLLTPGDSLLAIARAFKDKDPYFDERSFFEQLRENPDNLTQRQIRELAKGESDIFPNWMDLWVFPFPHGIKGSEK